MHILTHPIAPSPPLFIATFVQFGTKFATWTSSMATNTGNNIVRDLNYHEVDVQEYFYVVDKATLMHLPRTALTKGHGHALRCFMPPKQESYKFTSAKGTWLVGGRQGDKLFAITLPKLVSFHDERDDCVAVFFRIPEKGAVPWVVCWQPPFVDSKGDKVLATDDTLTACSMSLIKEFKPIANRSGGNMLTVANKCLAASNIFKHSLGTYEMQRCDFVCTKA